MRILILPLLAVLPLFATNSFSTSTACESATIYITSPTSCTYTGLAGGSAVASGTASVNFTPLGNSVFINVSENAMATPDSTLGTFGAISEFQTELDLESLNVGVGYVSLSVSGKETEGPGSGFASADAYLNGLTLLQCGGQPPPQSTTCVAAFSGPRLISLAGPLVIQFGQDVSATSKNSPSSAQGNINLQLSFYQADGITPAVLVQLPEPRTLWLLALSGIIFSAYGTYRLVAAKQLNTTASRGR